MGKTNKQREELIAQIKGIGAGQFFRIKVNTNVQTTAAAERAGVTIEKEKIFTTRTGCQYGNIEGVVQKEQSAGYKPKSNEEWIVPNRVKYNSNTGRYTLVLYPISQGAHPQVTYLLREAKKPMRIVTKEDLVPYVRASYWNEKPAPKMITVDLDNVVEIF